MFPGSRGSPGPSATSFWWAHCAATRKCRIRYTNSNPSSGADNVINPGDPWVHVEKVSFRPYKIWNSVLSAPPCSAARATSRSTCTRFCAASSVSPREPALRRAIRPTPARALAPSTFSWRLPYLRNWLTLYTDSEVHDDISPIDAPRRAAVRPGIYLSHVPGIPKLDLRVEGASTDPPTNTQYGRTVHVLRGD